MSCFNELEFSFKLLLSASYMALGPFPLQSNLMPLKQPYDLIR